MYCERCRRIVEGDKCPECGKLCKRDVKDDDACFLWSGGQIWADMVCDVLNQENIPNFKQGSIGAAMAVLTGLSAETFSVFVPYSHYEQAKEIAESLFQENEAEAEQEAEDAGAAETETEEDE